MNITTKSSVTSKRGVVYYVDKIHTRWTKDGQEEYAADLRNSKTGKTKYAVTFEDIDRGYLVN